MNEKKEKNKFTQSELDVLFPGRDVPIGEGIVVRVTPIPLPHIKDVLDAFGNLMIRMQSGMTPAKIAVECIKDAMELLPYCIDKEIEELPATAAPDLISAMLEINFNEDFVGKWTALAETISKATVMAQGEEKSPSQ